jgi:hypothetical protein
MNVTDMSMEQLQDAIRGAGWQWLEHVFNDGNDRDCYVRFSNKTSPHALDTRREDYDGESIGWGRFPRRDCWEMAYSKIVLGIDSPRL